MAHAFSALQALHAELAYVEPPPLPLPSHAAAAPRLAAFGGRRRRRQGELPAAAGGASVYVARLCVAPLHDEGTYHAPLPPAVTEAVVKSLEGVACLLDAITAGETADAGSAGVPTEYAEGVEASRVPGSASTATRRRRASG